MGFCCLYCLLSFYQSILSSQRRSVTSTSSSAESSVKAFCFHFAKIIIFSENLSFFCCFFSLFSLPCLSHSLPRLSHSLSWLSHSLPRLSHSVPWLLHSLPRLSHSVPRLSHSLPWFCCHIPLSNVCPTHPTCRGRSFKKLPGVSKLLPLQGALLIALYPGRCPGLWASAPSGRAACVFCPANCLIPRAMPWAESFCPLQGVLLASFARKSVHILGFSVTKGSPFYVICDVFVNTCEGRVHALNPLCLSGFRRRCEGWTLVSCFIRIRERK